MSDYIDIVFDGPPSHTSGRFVEVEDASGKSIKVGEWIERPDGFWVLRMSDHRQLEATIKRVSELLEQKRKAGWMGFQNVMYGWCVPRTQIDEFIAKLQAALEKEQ